MTECLCQWCSIWKWHICDRIFEQKRNKMEQNIKPMKYKRRVVDNWQDIEERSKGFLDQLHRTRAKSNQWLSPPHWKQLQHDDNLDNIENNKNVIRLTTWTKLLDRQIWILRKNFKDDHLCCDCSGVITIERSKPLTCGNWTNRIRGPSDYKGGDNMSSWWHSEEGKCRRWQKVSS